MIKMSKKIVKKEEVKKYAKEYVLALQNDGDEAWDKIVEHIRKVYILNEKLGMALFDLVEQHYEHVNSDVSKKILEFKYRLNLGDIIYSNFAYPDNYLEKREKLENKYPSLVKPLPSIQTSLQQVS